MMKTRGLSSMSLKKDDSLPQMLRIFNIGRSLLEHQALQTP